MLSATIQPFQGAVPDSAVLTNTSPELVLATGAQRAGRGIASAWHSQVTGKSFNTHSKVKCWETDSPAQVLWLLYGDLENSSQILGVILLFGVYGLAQHWFSSETLISICGSCVCVCVYPV